MKLISLHLFTDCFHEDFSPIVGTNLVPMNFKNFLLFSRRVVVLSEYQYYR